MIGGATETRTGATPPYVTAWSSEQGYVVRPEPLIGGVPALFSHRGGRGDGEPIWGRISEERQRECAVHGLCQVCHKPIGLPHEAGFSLVPPRELLFAGVPLPSSAPGASP